MARRMIDDSMWSNERFAEMPMGARLLQIGIINHADDQGRMKANPIYLRAQVFPYDDVSPKQIQEWLTLMATNDTIILYEVDGRAYLQLTNWWKYQSLQYAQPSQFPRPVGWKDRIRRTLTKGFIVTCNWQKVNGEPIEDTCDQDGKSLPGRKPRNDSASAPPENDAHNTPDEAHVDSDDSGDYSGESIPEHTIELNLTKLNENRKEGEYNAGAQDVTQNAEPLPPTSVGANGFDSMMNAARERANGNYGKRREQVQIDGIQKKLKDAGVSAEQFTVLVDEHLTQKGTKSLADGVGALADTELRNAQQFVIELISTGKRFHKTGGVKLLWDSWKANDKRPNPSELQLMQHAHQMVNGKIRKNGSVPNSVAKPSGTVLSKAENLR